jgi:hypothetical protein
MKHRIPTARWIIGITMVFLVVFLMIFMKIAEEATFRDKCRIFLYGMSLPLMVFSMLRHGYIEFVKGDDYFAAIFWFAFLGLEITAWARRTRWLAFCLSIYFLLSMAAFFVMLASCVPP